MVGDADANDMCKDAFVPISLGFACEVKYQIMRALNQQQAVRAEAQGQLFQSPERDITRHIFDWQITSLSATTAYLQNDFHGVFERADLYVDETYAEVAHRSLGTRHPHEFRAPHGEVLDEAVIDANYAAARSKFDYLAERFRRLLVTPGRYLYICTDARDDDQVAALLTLLSTRSRDHHAHLLLVAFEPPSPLMLDHAGRVHRDWRPVETPKAPMDMWQGDDMWWDKILERYVLEP